MLSGILIFNQKGENLIFRAFRNDCRPRLADVFRIQVISNAQVRSPILTLGSTTFSHVKHENIYLVVVTKSNANAAVVFEFIYRLIGLGKAYFGKFDEEAVKNNFVLVYELLDEILDFGYPQNTETDTLKMYITTEGVKSERAMVRALLEDPIVAALLTENRRILRKLQCKRPARHRGGEATSSTARTRPSWMSSKT
jgi:AP-2 complex subunit mu-1